MMNSDSGFPLNDSVDRLTLDLLFDPQTSGGLLFTAPDFADIFTQYIFYYIPVLRDFALRDLSKK